MKTVAIAALAAASTLSVAHAQDSVADGVNLGIGYSVLSVDDVDFDAVNLRAGYDFNDYFGVEAETLIGVGEEDFSIGAVSGDAELNYSFGAYGKAQYPVTDQFSVFARAGWVTSEVEADIAGLAIDESEDGLAYGAGAEYRFTDKHGVRADYTRYDFDDDAEADLYSASYVYRF
ncbi:porin family protein [Parvularcula sp. LCG005]|uniref:porin family protein n=1 Tax=Parvularcula sp. LCG005 TaxID=3078805 RepID=UPI002943B043|nr:porin family protein [Parvularcula sp. LCG005]WOI54666.1 porin family protein [Parvularcula sp. LCG005]